MPGGRIAAFLTQAQSVLEATWALLARSLRLTGLVLRGTVNPANLERGLVDEVFDLIRRRRVRAFVAFQRAEVRADGLRTNYLDRLPDLAVPTLIVHGEDDRFVPAAWAVRAGTLIPDAEVRILPRCGHWAPRERPERVHERLRDFLDRGLRDLLGCGPREPPRPRALDGLVRAVPGAPIHRRRS